VRPYIDDLSQTDFGGIKCQLEVTEQRSGWPIPYEFNHWLDHS